MEPNSSEESCSGISESIIDFIITIPIFDGLHAEDLQTTARHMNCITLEPGEYLFKEGDKGDYVCFVADGSLDVLKRSESYADVALTSLNRGRSIGEMSVIDNFPRSATVRARTRTTLVTLSRKAFDQLLDDHPKIGIKILKGISRLISQNLRKTSSRLVDYMLPLS